MKYTSLKQRDIKIKHIDVPKNGIDISKLPYDIEEDSLKYAKNIIYKNGMLMTRKGLSTKTDSILDTSICDGAEEYRYYTTETTVNISGEALRIAIVKVKYDNSHYFVLVYGIGESEKKVALGYLHFGRVDDATFYCPENVVFYSGKPQNGGGIFALVTLKNQGTDDQTDYAIYEMGSDYGEWQQNINYYIPTVYINGRGNAYESLNRSFSNEPLKPENRNLLDGSFYAYYSSDGYSSNFRLPFTNIDNSSIICRIYYSFDQYTEWRIAANETSDKQTFYGAEITANADRQKGIIYFTGASGEYSVPLMSTYSENNIRILAKKAIKNGFEAVVSSKCVSAYGERLLFSGGEEKNRLYYADYNTPLYFPQVFDNEIGFPDEAVTGLSIFDSRIIAFKAYRMYEISIESGGNFNTTALLADNGSIFKKIDTFSIKTISNSVGCSISDTVAVCGEKLIWLGTNGKLYSLSKSSNSAKIISQKADNLLNELISQDDIFGVGIGENYILCSVSKAIIINFDSGCYYWEFPQDFKIMGLVAFGQSVSFLYCYKQSECCYIAGLSGENDIMISGKGSTQNVERIPIESKFTLKSFDFNTIAQKKCVKSIDLRLYCKGKCRITVGDGHILGVFSLEQNIPFDDTVRLITDLTGVKHIEIDISSKKGISFGGADIYYTM